MWNASRYCETLTRAVSPEATIHQPTAPCSAPRANSSHSRQRNPGPTHPRQRKNRNGIRNTAPMVRPSNRCAHSHQKMVLNCASDMPRLSSRYCGICWYFSNSAVHCGFGERRQHAGDRLPFHDGKPGFRQPRGAADDQSRHHQCRHNQQPEADRPFPSCIACHIVLPILRGTYRQRAGVTIRLATVQIAIVPAACPSVPESSSAPSCCSCW